MPTRISCSCATAPAARLFIKRGARALLGLLVAFAAYACVRASTAAAQPAPMHLSTPAPDRAAGGAHARYSKAPIDLGLPDLGLLRAVLSAGGGSFDAGTLLGALAGSPALAQTETAALTKRFGPNSVDTFDTTFAFAMTDALAQFTTLGMALPSTPVPADPHALAAALFAAGRTPRGAFDAEYLLDALLSHPVHVLVMNDIDARPGLGFAADETYHRVLGALLSDVNAAVKP